MQEIKNGIDRTHLNNVHSSLTIKICFWRNKYRFFLIFLLYSIPINEMQPLFFGNNILHLLPYLKCFFRAGCKSLPAVIARERRCAEQVRFLCRRLQSGWEKIRVFGVAMKGRHRKNLFSFPNHFSEEKQNEYRKSWKCTHRTTPAFA